MNARSSRSSAPPAAAPGRRRRARRAGAPPPRGAARPADRLRDDHRRRDGARPPLGAGPRLGLRRRRSSSRETVAALNHARGLPPDARRAQLRPALRPGAPLRRGPHARARRPDRGAPPVDLAATRRGRMTSRDERASTSRLPRRRGLPPPERDALPPDRATGIRTATPSARPSASRSPSRRHGKDGARRHARRAGRAPTTGCRESSASPSPRRFRPDWPAGCDADRRHGVPRSRPDGLAEPLRRDGRQRRPPPGQHALRRAEPRRPPGRGRRRDRRRPPRPPPAGRSTPDDRDEPLGLARLRHRLVPLLQHDAEGARPRRAPRRGRARSPAA